MSMRATRRRFLQTSTAAAGLIVMTGAFRTNAYAANEKLNLANIGVGGRGGAHLEPASRQNMVAICDVDAGRLAGVGKKYPQAKPFADYRKLFDEMGKSIDGVYVATPDHHHAPASMAAIKMGKHVYCEKPLTHSIYEAHVLGEAARKHKVATQMGNGGMSSDGTRLLVEWIAAGAIGKVAEVHTWTDRAEGWWPQGVDRPAYTDPVPENLNWDLWLGPAPERPYVKEWRDGGLASRAKGVYHPFVWRGWCDFGTGALGDIACHALGPLFWALDLGYPTAVEAEVSDHHPETYPRWSIIRYEFPARGGRPPLKLTWYDGKKKPAKPRDLEAGRDLPDNGSYLVGDGGAMLFDGSPRLLPEARMKEFARPEKSIPRVKDHWEDWYAACRGGPPASSNFDRAALLTEAVLTGNLATRLGKRIEWDGPAMKAKNAPEAAALVRREYRKGWTL